jgi:hypothetical protein
VRFHPAGNGNALALANFRVVSYTDASQKTAFEEVWQQTVKAPGQSTRFGHVELRCRSKGTGPVTYQS